MVIEEKDFRLINVEETDRFDLELLYVVNAKDAEKRREEFRNSGYSMSIEKCISKIVFQRLEKKQEVYTLKTFLESYRQITKEIEDLVKL